MDDQSWIKAMAKLDNRSVTLAEALEKEASGEAAIIWPQSWRTRTRRLRLPRRRWLIVTLWSPVRH